MLLFIGVVRAQETQVLLQNEQIKVEVTKYSESCALLRTGKGNPSTTSAEATCTEMAITNNSNAPITAWLATSERGGPGAPGRITGMSIRTGDSVIFAEDRANNAEILPRDTHRVTMETPARVDFKAAVFQDGSVFGATEWVDRIVQNRRLVYRDVAEALKRLRLAQQAGTPREQVISDFQELERNEKAQEQASLRTLPRQERLILPRLGVYGTVAGNLASSQTDAAAFSNDLSRVESMLLTIGSRLLVSHPRLSDHPVPLGEPLESTVAIEHDRH
jgi:hypothetical protein